MGNPLTTCTHPCNGCVSNRTCAPPRHTAPTWRDKVRGVPTESFWRLMKSLQILQIGRLWRECQRQKARGKGDAAETQRGSLPCCFLFSPNVGASQIHPPPLSLCMCYPPPPFPPARGLERKANVPGNRQSKKSEERASVSFLQPRSTAARETHHTTVPLATVQNYKSNEKKGRMT